MERKPDQSALSYYLGCTMYVAAAMDDATPHQREQIQKRSQWAIATRDPEGIVEAVNSVMGPEWKPADKWRGFWDEAWD